MQEAHEHGTPVMRPLFYEFPDDDKCWEVEDQYMFGGKYLCAPVLGPEMRVRKVYLPSGGKWKEMGVKGAGILEGGREVEVECPIERMPVFEREQ